jgi:ubiquinone/menaquinone biosynthesis C-methylase UbiE
MSLKRIQAFFDERAADWDAACKAQTLARMAEILGELDIRKGQRVLDVGSGTGALFPHVAQRVGKEGLLVGLDVAFEMARRARAKLHQAACVLADACFLPLQPNTFDWVLCYSVFPHFEDPFCVLVELAQTLRPGGSLAVFHSNSRDAINTFHEAVGDVVGGHVLPAESEMRRLIDRAGLRLTLFDARDDRYVVTAVKL